MTTALITASHLVKSYGKRHVVDDISLRIEPGEVLAVIGPNGAGKTTTLEIILGLRHPDSGSVTLWRKDALGHIGVQLQSTPFFRSLTAAENLRIFAAFYHVTLNVAQLQALLTRCGLAEVAAIPATRLSGGQQKRLAIALTLAHQPQLLFLDEPTAPLDPRGRRDIRHLIGTLAAQHTAIVFTSHDMEEVEKLATRVVLITNGRIRADDAPQTLCQKFQVPSLEALYLQLTDEEQ